MSIVTFFVIESHKKWSHDPESNRGPLPYHGSALPTELSRLAESNYMKATFLVKFRNHFSDDFILTNQTKVIGTLFGVGSA